MKALQQIIRRVEENHCSAGHLLRSFKRKDPLIESRALDFWLIRMVELWVF